MNPSNPKHPWSRLTAAARTVRDEREVAAPYGFATRVTALAFAHERRFVSLIERFAFRALGVACLLALVSVAANYSLLTGANPTVGAVEEEVPVEDAVAVLLVD